MDRQLYEDELREQVDSIILIAQGILNSIDRGHGAMFAANSRELLVTAKHYARIAPTYKEILDRDTQAKGNGRHG